MAEKELDRLLSNIPRDLDFESHFPYRMFWKVEEGVHRSGYGFVQKRVRVQRSEADLVSSLCTNGKHAPTLDIDFPARLIPSSTPGHFHLYLECQMSWWRYRRMMKALWKAGVIEKGYYKQSVRHGRSDLRPPEVSKYEVVDDPKQGLPMKSGSKVTPVRSFTGTSY